MIMPNAVIEPYTYRDLQNFPEDGKKREVIGGELFVAAAPSTRHQRLLVELVTLINIFLRKKPMGNVFVAPTEVMFDEFDSVEPDIFVVLKNSRAEITEKRVVGAPDWIIEVLSPSNSDYDLETKRKLYRSHGVLYWVVSPVDETITVWSEEKHVYKAGDEIEVAVLSGFRLNVAELFSVVAH
jgi:Uma2 family endonuclease